MPGFVRMDDDVKMSLYELIACLRFARKRLFMVVAESPNSGVQVRALRTITDSVVKEFKMLQSVGLLPCVSTRR